MKDISKITDTYPNWYYIGSKRSILPWIIKIINDSGISYDSVVDLYGGSGIVSHTMLSLGKSIWYNDLLPSTTNMVKTLINYPVSLNITDINIEDLFTRNNNISYFNFAKQYLQSYFTQNECLELDTILSNLVTIKDDLKRGILFYCLTQAVIQKQSAGTFHDNTMNWRRKDNDPNSTWNLPLKHLMKQALLNVQQFIFNKKYFNQNGSLFSCLSDREFDPNDIAKYDLVYADPPFASLQSGKFGNYTIAYHMIEFFYNYPEINISSRKMDSNLLKFKESTPILKSNRMWLQPEFVHESFDWLISLAGKTNLVLSYRLDGRLSKNVISNKCKTNWNNVEIKVRPHYYDNNEKNSKYTDLLIVAYNN